MRIPRIGGSDRQEGSGYVLMNEELLEYEGLHGMRSLCHLLIYRSGSKPVVCVAGNFDGGLGASTTDAIEIVATAVAARIGQEDFRLVEWYPHHGGQPPFSEVTLAAVEPTKLVHGEVVAADMSGAHTTRRHSAVIRFANPQWAPQREDDLAKLLGEEPIRDLRSFAGMHGDYTAERLFGNTGRQQAEAVRAHNRQVADGLEAHLSEWT
jgi:hypothetical protein